MPEMIQAHLTAHEKLIADLPYHPGHRQCHTAKEKKKAKLKTVEFLYTLLKDVLQVGFDFNTCNCH